MRRILATLALASVASCSGLGGDLEQRIDGTWTGASNSQSVSLVIVQTQGVTGIATISGGTGGTRSFAVAGTFQTPTLNATLSGSAPGDTITLAATVSGKSMVGTLSGAGFTGNAIALQRQ